MTAWTKENRIAIILNSALLLCLVIGWILYALFGHRLVEAMYKGESIELLDSLVEGQRIHPLEHYLRVADRMMWVISLGVIVLGSVLTFLIKTWPLVHVLEWVDEYVLARTKDFLVALSLANLLHKSIWDDMLFNYSQWRLSGAVSLIALALNILLMTLIIWCGGWLVRNSSFSAVKVAGGAGFLTLVIVALYGVSAPFPELWVGGLQQRFGKVGHFVPGLILGVLLLYYLRARRQMISAATIVLVILSPLVLIQFGNAVWLWHKGALTTSRPLSQPLPAKEEGEPRIIWIVFDELDYRLTFSERPASVQLPEFDRLCSQSIVASRAVSPAENTQESMPSLVTGRIVTATERIQLDEWLLTLSDKEKAAWSTLPNVFSLAREAGFNSGIAGWWIPYCRIIGQDLTACSSQLHNDRHRKMTLPEAMLDEAKEVLPANLPNWVIDKNARRLRIYQRQTHLLVYQGVVADATTLAVDRNLGLVLLHYPVPHTPGIYDRRRDELSIEPGGNYLDNLRLADRTMSKLRATMEQAGLWEQTIVLVTSDHRWHTEYWEKRLDWTPEEAALAASFSTSDRRVPYVLKLADQKRAYAYDQPFNTVITRDLLLALLRGELASTDSVVDWLNQHRSIS